MPTGSESVGMAVANRSARLSEIVPAVRAISNRVMQSVSESLAAAGTPVSCRKRCPACCRYLVPLSAPEAFRISEEVTAMPLRHRGRIVERYVRAAQTVLRAGPPRLADSLHPQVGFDDTLSRVSRWYAGLELECPFLVRRICAIYAARPLACREHVVTHDPALCADPQHAPAEGQVSPPVSLTCALSRLAAEVENTEPEAIMLPLAMMWAQDHRQRAERTYPAVELFERLVDILRRQAGSADERLAQTA